MRGRGAAPSAAPPGALAVAPLLVCAAHRSARAFCSARFFSRRRFFFSPTNDSRHGRQTLGVLTPGAAAAATAASAHATALAGASRADVDDAGGKGGWRLAALRAPGRAGGAARAGAAREKFCSHLCSAGARQKLLALPCHSTRAGRASEG